MNNTKKNKHLGGGAEPKISQKYASLVALGLSSLLPNFAVASDSNDTFNQLLSTVPSNPSDSKVKNLASYSPVVDLRTPRATIDYTQNPPFPSGGTWDSDTTINVNIQSVNYLYWSSRIFRADNGATVTMNFNVETPQGSWDNKGILTENERETLAFDGDGFFDITANITGNASDASASFIGTWDTALYSAPRTRITSRLKFQARGNVRNFIYLFGAQNGNGTHIFNSPYLEVDMSGSTYANNGNNERFIFDSSSSTTPNVYFNANQSDNSQAYNESSILKFTGSIGTGIGARLYAYFTNADSFLKGNIYLNDGESKISFSNNALMIGDIKIQGNGNHSISFDNADFAGVIKSNNSGSNSSNTTIAFKNTAGHKFGSTTDGVVDSSFKGTVIGNFDVSSNSSTTINSGSDGSKGFLGTGTNKLVFDFKNSANAKTSFTLGGGNANSYYVFDHFTSNGSALDLSKTTQGALLPKVIEEKGVHINENINGTIFFRNTSINVGNQKLFASSQVSTNYASASYGAMFGNALWTDNGDETISSDEIGNTSGNANYKLTGTGSQNGIADSNSSTGNIGNTDDNITKQVAFIFKDGTYTFGGGSSQNSNEDTHGYTGTILGGTNESKYYFANAGYISGSQVQNAKGQVILFNTAFRGDLGVKNTVVNTMLDFSNNRNGLRDENGNGNSNIVGSGTKNITFNFTKNTNAIKYSGSIVGATTDPSKFAFLNLKKYTSDGVIGENNGEIASSGSRGEGAGRKGSITLIEALRNVGVTNFDIKQDAWNTSGYPQVNGVSTNVENIDSTKTTLALYGSSLNADNVNFDSYTYDLRFGKGLGDIEGVAIEKDGKLRGHIDLSSNTMGGNTIIVGGDGFEDNAKVTFNSTTSGNTFAFDDSLGTNNTPLNFTLGGLSQNNYLSVGSSINISKTNFTGDIWIDNSSAVNLDFRDDRTWSMDTSGIYLKSGSNLVVHGVISAITQVPSTTPTLKIRTSTNQQNIQLLNTGANVVWKNDVGYNQTLSQTFNLRGTSLTTSNRERLSGVIGTGTFNLVFAKGSALQTNVSNNNSCYYKITDIGLENIDQYKGTYGANGYVGNYIAESSGAITGINSNSGFNITFIGSEAWNASEGNIATNNYFGKTSTLTLVNASDKWNASGGISGISAGYVGRFFQRDFGTEANIVIEGTSLDWGNENNADGGIVRRSNNQDKLNFTITFINEGESNDSNIDKTYVGDKYGDLATTTANGTLKDSILKVQESKLVNGLDFRGANANVLFVGDNSQSLNGAGTSNNIKILKGGSATSTFTFRDSNLNAGNGTSSIQSVAGTIAFDLTHSNEDMEISGTLKNMFGTSQTGHYQTKFNGSITVDDGTRAQETIKGEIIIPNLVFTTTSGAKNSDTLAKLQVNGMYFNDSDTFGSLVERDYEEIGMLANIDDTASSNLTLADGSVVALSGANTEVIFIGTDSHGFSNTTQSDQVDAEPSINTFLGDSTGSTLTFIDAGTLKIDNLLNVDSSTNTQQGKGIINLIGNTRIETQEITSNGSAKTTLSLMKSGATGAGIIINAVFTGSNVLGTGTTVVGDTDSSLGSIASNINIGQTNEQTEYHILFDYTQAMEGKDKQGFGQYQVYQGTITGLTSDSIIKFKNAGYINNDQIANTQATILVDNTQIKGNFKGDYAILDFRNGSPAIEGNILTSDTTNTKLSQKVITFDLTGTLPKTTLRGTPQALTFEGKIQAGDKVASAYTTTAPSILTFQNAPDMTIGASTRGTNPSAFIQSLVSDVGFAGIANAETTAPEAPDTIGESTSYILAGTKLAFQGTNISAGDTNKTITENTYDLDLSFDNRQDNRGTTGLGEALKQSVLTANTIVMGDNTTARNLSLSFAGSGSLIGQEITNNEKTFANVLNVKLKDDAIFNLTAIADVDNEEIANIGTILLTENETTTMDATTPTATPNLSAKSSMKIDQGSMNFIGVFDTSKDTSTTNASDYGTLSLSFGDMYETITDENGTETQQIIGNNKAYGVIAHKGDTSITLTGDALFSDDEAQKLGFTKSEDQFANLVIDATAVDSGKTLSLNLAHTSGMVGVIGATLQDSATSQSSFTSINLSNTSGNIALKGAFDLGSRTTSFSKNQLAIVGNAYLKISSGGSLSIVEGSILSTQADQASRTSTLYIDALGNSNDQKVNLTLTNLDSNINVVLINKIPFGKMWGYSGAWNIKGTNIQLSKAFWAEGSGNAIKMTFAKGNGTDTTLENLKLSELSTSDKINTSALTGSIAPNQQDGNYNTNGDGSSMLLKNGSLTFIGKESLGLTVGQERIDGSYNSGGTLKFGLYNSLLKSGSIMLDSSVLTNNSNRSISDKIDILGTDTFNLSVSKIAQPSNATRLYVAQNNSTINAVFVNGDNLAKQVVVTPDVSDDTEVSTPELRVATASTPLTGNTYIDAENAANTALQSTLAQYATSNAGGTLSQTQLKTLQSKAYGNITLDNTVTATMKFIGDNSHSFDGKTIVAGSGTSAKVYTYVGSGSIADVEAGTPSVASDWTQLEIGSDGLVSFKTSDANPTDTTTKYAQLIGGNSSSRFDFDHTSVALDLVKFAGGSTYVYNSSVSGSIGVTASGGVGSSGVAGNASPNIQGTSSTTIFFNQAYTEGEDGNMTDAVKTFQTTYANDYGINLDLSTAHQLTQENLTDGKLTTTEKTTNLIILGADAVDNDSQDGNINLNFLPTLSEESPVSGYNYTIVSGGRIDLDDYTTQLGSNPADDIDSATQLSGKLFGSSKVLLIDTELVGKITEAVRGFIDVDSSIDKNVNSAWGGSEQQQLIFNFHNGASNQLLYGGKSDAISNTNESSTYIFSGIYANSDKATSEGRTLSLSDANSLKSVINTQLKNVTSRSGGVQVIDEGVVGFLGLRGISVQGDIDESIASQDAQSREGDTVTAPASGNKVNIVFNSTDNIQYQDYFDTAGDLQGRINVGEKNLVSTDAGDDTVISGYAVLKAGEGKDGVVTIKGNATKYITFIGDKAVNEEVGGFEKLVIEEGDANSFYTFHSVGTLSDGFLQGVKLQKNGDTNTTANLGTFTIINSTINGDINVDANASDSNTENKARLVLDNVVYSGSISGSLIKDVKFAKGSNDIKIIGGSENSSYDFSNLAGSSINLNIDMRDATPTRSDVTYIAPTITGFENGDISLVGTLHTGGDTTIFAFNNDASWTLTDSSRVQTLYLENTGSNFNLDLASASRSNAVTPQVDEVGGESQVTPSTDLRVLEVGTLASDGGQVLLGTQIDTNTQSNSKSDKIKATNLEGTLYVTAKDAVLNSGTFSTDSDAIVLVEATTANAEVKGVEKKQGLSYVATVLEHQIQTSDSDEVWTEATDENINNATSHRWVLSSLDASTNQELVDESGFIVSNPYRMLMIETNNLNKRMGDLRDNDYNQGAWIRVFNGSDSGEGSKNLYTNIQLGYDYGTPAIGAKNYSGVAFSTSIVDIDGSNYSGKANTYSLAAYNSYIADSGFYVDTIGKYLYTDQKLSPNGSSDSSFGSHALSLGLEIGYRAYMGESNFYFETQAEAIGGVIFGVNNIDMGVVNGMNVVGDLKTTLSLNTRIGIVQGYSLKTQSGFRADFRLGVSLVNESVNNDNSITLYDSITEASTSIANDTKAVLNVGTNLILTDQWRVYLDAERSFGGKRNVDYQANIGARFSFGDITKPLPKPEKPLPLKVEEKK